LIEEIYDIAENAIAKETFLLALRNNQKDQQILEIYYEFRAFLEICNPLNTD